MPAVNDRPSPSDEALERRLIGHTLNLRSIPEAAETLTPAEFWRPEHATVWAAVLELGGDVDAVRDRLLQRRPFNGQLDPVVLLDWMAHARNDDSHLPYWIGSVLLFPAVWSLARRRPHLWPAVPLIVLAY